VGEKIGLVDPINPSAHPENDILPTMREKAKETADTVKLAGQHVGWEAKAQYHEAGQKAEKWSADAHYKLYEVGGKAGLLFPYIDTTGLYRPMASENALQEILEGRQKLGLAEPEETQPEFGRGRTNVQEERPLSSERVKDEILEARENLGLEKPLETTSESGRGVLGMQEKNFIGNEHQQVQTKALPA
jgi:hypothetical protein